MDNYASTEHLTVVYDDDALICIFQMSLLENSSNRFIVLGLGIYIETLE